MAQITLLLDQEETAARMAKTAELIRDKPTGEQFAQLTRTHLTRWYPHTAAGREAIDHFRNEETEENESPGAPKQSGVGARLACFSSPSVLTQGAP